MRVKSQRSRIRLNNSWYKSSFTVKSLCERQNHGSALFIASRSLQELMREKGKICLHLKMGKFMKARLGEFYDSSGTV